MRPRIAIVGAGAIGSFYGAKLARAGSDVHFLLRSNLETVRRAGICVRGKDEDFRLAEVQAYGNTAEIGPCDLVLVALKTTSNAALVDLIPPLLHPRTMLLTLQNGLGNEAFLAKHFGAERVLGGLCFVCLNHVAPGVIEHYDIGRVTIGEYRGAPHPRTHEVVGLFTHAGVNCAAVENLALERWRKLVWNIPFNGLAVTAGVATDAILNDPELHCIALDLMHEVINAANRCGIALPHAEAEVQMQRTHSLGAYKPSTLIDFEAGRPLEIEAIWGEPLRLARAADIETPRLEELYERLRRMDRSRQLS